MSTLAHQYQEAALALADLESQIIEAAQRQIKLERPIIDEVFHGTDIPQEYCGRTFYSWLQVAGAHSGRVGVDLWVRGQWGGEDQIVSSLSLSPALLDGREAEFKRDFRETCRLKLASQERLRVDNILKKKAELEAALVAVNKALT
jgi:hypothetical protein